MIAPAVTLRPVRDDDGGRILAWRNTPEVAAYMYTPHAITPREHARWFAGLKNDPKRAYWIILMDGRPVGLANLADIDRVQGRCSWAYYLADPETRGKGMGSYVEYWMLQQVFETMNMRKLWCEVLASNEAVWKLHESFGFVQEARFRAHVLKNSEPQDVLGLGILAQEWRERRPAMREKLAAKGYSV